MIARGDYFNEIFLNPPTEILVQSVAFAFFEQFHVVLELLGITVDMLDGSVGFGWVVEAVKVDTVVRCSSAFGPAQFCGMVARASRFVVATHRQFPCIEQERDGHRRSQGD